MKQLVTRLRETLATMVRDRTSAVLASAVLLLVLWGQNGSVNALSLVWSGWTGPGSAGNPARAVIIHGIPWDQEWLSFFIGFALLVAVPCALIRFAFRERLSDYGLGLPQRGTGSFAAVSAIVLLAISLPGIWFGAHRPEVRALYPLYRNFASDGQFVVYELGYFSFFLASEFVFRGYILFGAEKARPGTSAVFVAMVAHVLWHLSKPVMELSSTLVWSVVAGTIVLATRSIWPIVVVHWLTNVFMDLVIWKGW